jgi:multiple sugar transport system permease protein
MSRISLEAGRVGVAAGRRRVSTARRRHVIEGYLYTAPWLIGFVVLTLVPVALSLYYSFTSYDVISPQRWVGLQNYIRAFTKDSQFWPSLAKTFYYAGVTVPLGVLGSLLLAIFLNIRVKGTALFRTLFFMPSLVPVVASTVLWLWLFDPDWGPVNNVLRTVFHVTPPRWFQDPTWAIPGLITLALWTSLGGTRMIIFLAGLQGVPEELYDAAAMDGAGWWGRLRHVTLPMLTPTIYFNLILGIIGALQVFASAFVATQGGPAYATTFYSLLVYNNAFQYFDMGYAAALAWLFAILIILLTLLQVRLSRTWVYYGGE